MPQKKVAKRKTQKKSTAKPEIQRSLLALAENIEKEFRQIPTKLSKLYRQELKIQKQLESKLKSDIKKTTATQKKALKKQPGSIKAKQAAKTIKILTQKLDQVKKTAEKLQGKQKKYVAFKKGLAQLEKQLSLTQKTKVKKHTVSKKTKSLKPKFKQTEQQPRSEETMTEETPFMISSKKEIVEM